MISSSTYLATIARRLLRRAWWLPVLALTVIAGGMAYDVRFAIIGLMLLFIIYPMIMSFAIMRYATLPTLARRTLANTFELHDDTLSISQITEDEENGDTKITPIESAHVTGIYHHGDNVIFEIGPAPADIIIVPTDALNPQILSNLESKLMEDY